MIAGIEIENGSCDPDHVPWFVIRRIFFSLNRSPDISGGPNFKIGHMALTTPLLGRFVIL